MEVLGSGKSVIGCYCVPVKCLSLPPCPAFSLDDQLGGHRSLLSHGERVNPFLAHKKPLNFP